MNQGNGISEREKELEKSMHEMCHLLSKYNDPDFMYDFFECLFTPAELHDFANRWLLVKEIRKGTTQREIARMFGMSLCKITRGARELKKPDSAFRRMLELIEQNNQNPDN